MDTASVRKLRKQTQFYAVSLPMVSLLEPHLATVRWNEPGQESTVTPMEVLHNPDEFPHHYQKIMDAKLSVPLLVEEQTFRVLDGDHRLAKAVHLKMRWTRVRYVNT